MYSSRAFSMRSLNVSVASCIFSANTSPTVTGIFHASATWVFDLVMDKNRATFPNVHNLCCRILTPCYLIQSCVKAYMLLVCLHALLANLVSATMSCCDQGAVRSSFRKTAPLVRMPPLFTTSVFTLLPRGR